MGYLFICCGLAQTGSLIVRCITRAHRQRLAHSHATADRSFDGQRFADLSRPVAWVFYLPTRFLDVSTCHTPQSGIGVLPGEYPSCSPTIVRWRAYEGSMRGVLGLLSYFYCLHFVWRGVPITGCRYDSGYAKVSLTWHRSARHAKRQCVMPFCHVIQHM